MKKKKKYKSHNENKQVQLLKDFYPLVNNATKLLMKTYGNS